MVKSLQCLLLDQVSRLKGKRWLRPYSAALALVLLLSAAALGTPVGTSDARASVAGNWYVGNWCDYPLTASAAEPTWKYPLASEYASYHGGSGDLYDYVLDIDGPSDTVGAAIHLWLKYNTTSQDWCFKPVSYDSSFSTLVTYTSPTSGQTGVVYQLANGYSGQGADIVGPSSSDGTDVHQWTCKGHSDSTLDSQLWAVVRAGTGAWGYPLYQLINIYSGTCLDDTGWGTTSGVQLDIWGCKAWDGSEDDTSNQLFDLLPADVPQ